MSYDLKTLAFMSNKPELFGSIHGVSSIEKMRLKRGMIITLNVSMQAVFSVIFG